jgi:calmodulin
LGKDNDGAITTSDLGLVMRSLGYNLTEIQLQKIIDEFDADKSGSMNFREFLQMMLRRDMHDEEANDRFADLLQTFGMFDRDGDGYISPGELRDAMFGLGQCFSWCVMGCAHVDDCC